MGEARRDIPGDLKSRERRSAHPQELLSLDMIREKACFDCPYNVTDCQRPHCVTGDGFERGIVVINRLMPGPTIAVCKGDLVVVDVYNGLFAEVTSLHFHGEHMRDFQFMDGVPYVTQCPILPMTRFRYEFEAQVAGTHFYHSHNSFQRGDGAYGAYIVRKPRTIDPHSHLYDFDLTTHVILPQEWFHSSTREAFALHHWDNGTNKPDNILVNGKGQNSKWSPSNVTLRGPTLPFTVFKVEQGHQYRFRVINPGFALCPLKISVENHNLLMIASDGSDFEPITVNAFVIHAGERFDFILNANQTPSTYVMRFGGLFDCKPNEAHGIAVIHYSGANYTDNNFETKYEDFVKNYGIELGPVNHAPMINASIMASSTLKIPVTQLRGIYPSQRDCQSPPTKNEFLTTSGEEVDGLGSPEYCSIPSALVQEQADKIFYLGFDLYPKNNPHYHHENFYSFENVKGEHKLRTPQINNVTLKLPSSPLLSQEAQIDQSEFCDEEKLKEMDCGESVFCECVYILRASLNDIVELVLIDEGVPYDISHPFHLHGHAFYVVAMERHAKNSSHIGPTPYPGNSLNRKDVVDMDQQGKIYRNLKNPPLKDVASVPDGGFSILRFHANNPGYWLFHCHMSWHNHLGMGVILQVGDLAKDLPQVPENFPKCGNFS